VEVDADDGGCLVLEFVIPQALARQHALNDKMDAIITIR
jgi:hypothetical protein